MQFIDFKKEHFTRDEEKNDYFLEISKIEIDAENIRIQRKEEDKLFDDVDYEIADHPILIMVILKKPEDIRVNF